MKKYETISDQFVHLRNCQRNLYEAIQYRQKQLSANLQQHINKYNCQIDRKNRIVQHNYPQQITHPNNNHIYMYLGNCIQDFQCTDLDDIKNRQEERRKQRERIQQLKILQQTGKSIYGSQQVQIQKITIKEIKQIPWKLMRKIRQQQVQENKKRLEKKNQNKKQKIAENLKLKFN